MRAEEGQLILNHISRVARVFAEGRGRKGYKEEKGGRKENKRGARGARNNSYITENSPVKSRQSKYAEEATPDCASAQHAGRKALALTWRWQREAEQSQTC